VLLAHILILNEILPHFSVLQGAGNL